MGKAAKVVLPLAAVGAGLWAAGAFAPAVTPLGGGLVPMTAPVGGSAAGFLSSTGSWFSNIGSSIATKFADAATLTLATVAGGAQLLGGFTEAGDMDLRRQEIARRQRLASLQALQTEAQAIKARDIARGNAMAMAAAQGQDMRGRSFLAFMDDQQTEAERQMASIRVTAEAGMASSALQMRQFGKARTSAILSGVGGAARSLLTAVA